MLWLVSPVSPKGNFINDYEMTPEKDDRVTSAFLSEKAAIAAAQKKATENPTKQFAVFSVSAVFETTTPKIIRKKLDDRGQLVVASDD